MPNTDAPGITPFKAYIIDYNAMLKRNTNT